MTAGEKVLQDCEFWLKIPGAPSTCLLGMKPLGYFKLDKKISSGSSAFPLAPIQPQGTHVHTAPWSHRDTASPRGFSKYKMGKEPAPSPRPQNNMFVAYLGVQILLFLQAASNCMAPPGAVPWLHLTQPSHATVHSY